MRNGTTWSEQAYLKASQVSEYDEFGVSVAVSEDTVVVGATGEGSSTTGINSTPDEIMEEARKCIVQAGRKGGYILGSGCVVPRNARKRNIEALRIASEQYGLYKNGHLTV